MVNKPGSESLLHVQDAFCLYDLEQNQSRDVHPYGYGIRLKKPVQQSSEKSGSLRRESVDI